MTTPDGTQWRPRRIAGLVFVVVAIGFLIYFIGRDLDRLRDHEWAVDPQLLLTSVIVNIAGLFWGVASWRILLRMQGYVVPLKKLARIWFVSGLGRYIPGKIWQFVGAAHLGKAAGLPALVTASSLAVHTVIFLLAAIMVSLYLMPAAAMGLSIEQAERFRLMAPLFLLTVHPWVMRRILTTAARLTGRDFGEWKGTWAGAVIVLMMAVFAWFITGIGLFMFVSSLTPLPPVALPDVIAFNAFAFVAGYLVVIAPAGLGAKEGALAALLALIVPVPVAALLAVGARLWSVAGEVIPAMFFMRSGIPALKSTEEPPSKVDPHADSV